MRELAWWDRHATKVNGLTGEELPDEPHHAAWKWATSLDEAEGHWRKMRAQDALTLYYGTPAHATFDDAGDIEVALVGESSSDEVAYNVIQSCTDTMVSHIIRNKVRPMFVTEKGDSELKEKAAGMQRAVEGVFEQAGIYGETGVEVCSRGEMFEAGGVKSVPDYANSRVDIQLVWAHQFFVSAREARAGNVRQMAHVYDVDRNTLLDFFKDAPEETLRAIRDAAPVKAELSQETAVGDTVSDRIKVAELWHLPSGRVDLDDPKSFGQHETGGEVDPKLDPGHDGRRVMCIADATLIDEPWPYDHFPVAWFKPRKKPGKYWSRGVPEVLASAQLKLNQWNRRIDGILNLHAVPRLIVWTKAKLNRGKFTNDYASVINSSVPPGQAVMKLDPNSVPKDLIERVDRLIAWAEKQVGLSEMSIAGTKPPAVNHEPGMQMLQDTEAIRHTTSFRAWEQFHLDLAKVVVETIRLLAQRNPGFEIMFGDSKDLKRIKWTEVDMKRNQYHLKCWPTNLLPQTPAAKASRVITFLREGLFTPEQALEAIDHPDIESIMGDRVAERQNIEQYIARARASGRDLDESTVPHAYLNLQLAQKMCKDAINRAEADGERPERIEGVIALFEAVTAELKKMAPPAPPGGSGPPVPPTGPVQPGPPGPAAAAAPPIDPTMGAAA